MKFNNKYDSLTMEKIKYGLEGIYLTISKTIILIIICSFLGILMEFLILTILFNGIRLFAFGLHLSKSSLCLFISGFVFITFTCLASDYLWSPFTKLFVWVICFIIIFLYAPADTHKRPLVNEKKRRKFKFLSIVIAFLYGIIAVLSNNILLSNCLIFSLIIESSIILPVSYKLFGLPYNNYKNYHDLI